jgi:hypothetical protein
MHLVNSPHPSFIRPSIGSSIKVDFRADAIRHGGSLYLVHSALACMLRQAMIVSFQLNSNMALAAAQGPRLRQLQRPTGNCLRPLLESGLCITDRCIVVSMHRCIAASPCFRPPFRPHWSTVFPLLAPLLSHGALRGCAMCHGDSVATLSNQRLTLVSSPRRHSLEHCTLLTN